MLSAMVNNLAGGRNQWSVSAVAGRGLSSHFMTTVEFRHYSLAARVAMGGENRKFWQALGVNVSHTNLPLPLLGEEINSHTYTGAQHANKGSATERHIDAVLFIEETWKKSVGAHRFYGAAPGERSKLPVGMLHL